jgi:hypothetical protein
MKPSMVSRDGVPFRLCSSAQWSCAGIATTVVCFLSYSRGHETPAIAMTVGAQMLFDCRRRSRDAL